MRQLRWMFLALALMSGCGDSEPTADTADAQTSSPDAVPGDGAASHDAASGDAASPFAAGIAIHFPLAQSRTDAGAITVRGKAASPERIAAIRVAGVEATTTDGYATWQATVPLAPGHNTLDIAVEVAEGTIEPELPALRITRSTPAMLPIHPSRTAIDLSQSRAFTISVDSQTVSTMALSSGVAEMAVEQATGPAFTGPQATLYDAASNRLFVLNKQPAELHSDLFAVDLATGVRVLVSEGSTNFATDVRGPATSLIYDEARGRIVALDSSRRSAVAIDLTTGVRSIVTSPSTGSGPSIGRPRSMALDAAQNRILLGDCYFSSLYAADLTTGDRIVIASADTGEGVGLGCPLSIAMDPDGQHAWVVSRNAKGDAVLLKLDLSTGNRTEISRSASTPDGTDVGTGVGFLTDAKVTFDPGTGRVLLVSRSGLVAVDPETGNRAYAWDTGSLGLLLGSPTAGALDISTTDVTRRRAIIADQAHRQLIAVDLASGLHQPLFDAAGGLPGAPLAFSALTADPAQGHAYLVWVEQSGGELLNHVAAIDIATGRASTLASMVGDMRAAVAMDSPQGRMFLVHAREYEQPSLCREFTITAMAGHGGDSMPVARIHPCTDGGDSIIPELSTVDALAWNPSDGHLVLVGMSEAGAVLVVLLDPATGMYQILDDNAFGGVDASRIVWTTYVHPASSTIFVAGGRVLKAYDPTTQSWASIADIGVGSGPALTDPRSLAIDGNTGTAVVTDAAYRAVMVIDLATQERVLALP